MQTNDVRIAAAGAGAWAVAFVVLLIVGLPSDDRWWLWVCATGFGSGLFGVWYVPRLQARRAAQEAARAAQREADTEPAGTEAEPVDGEAGPGDRAVERESAD